MTYTTYTQFQTASGWAIERSSDNAYAEFLDREDCDDALSNLESAVIGDEEDSYEWQADDDRPSTS